jgi:Tfp pilus assembly protein PilE
VNKEFLKNKKGITLVALVATIVIMLILARNFYKCSIRR